MIKLEKPRIDTVQLDNKYQISTDVLRLDMINPVVSGNKWYKLKEYLKEALALNKKVIVTYGGAFSNHIVATAAAAQAFRLKSIGIIRGEKPTVLSHTLKNAIDYGMELIFVSRDVYKNKELPPETFLNYTTEDIYLVNEGGYGVLGMNGATHILGEIETGKYDHIIAASGTGTTLAGLIDASTEHQQVLGISILKNNFSVVDEIKAILPQEKWDRINIIFDYHFGGYARSTMKLISFMNDWYEKTGIPSDFVYTGKLFFAVNDLIQKGYFKEGSQILVIHSGGLQGNLSLANGSLIFQP
jgi:1-aminocyclopropane-1-carboxylate deaminase